MQEAEKELKRVKRKFIRKLIGLNYKLNGFYQKNIKPDTPQETKFIKFLNDVVSLKIPVEIQNDDDVFETLFLLQSEARQTLREISWDPC